MRNFFARNYISYALLILISFCLAGLVFTFQINRYSLVEKQKQLDKTAARVADMTSMLMGEYTEQLSNFYRFNMLQIAEEYECAILITDVSGNVLLYTDKYDLYNTDMMQVNRTAVSRTLQHETYSEMGTFGEIFYETSYIVGKTCRPTPEAAPVSLVFVAASATSVVELLTQVSRSFLTILSLALMTTLVLSYFISDRITKPLKTMVYASRKFANGDFSVRVFEDNHCDEIDELAMSFNSMATDLEKLEELSRTFVASVSHELKTPMTSISGFVDGMLDGTIPTENREKYLKIVSEEVHRLSRLVTRMLEAAKIQSGDVALKIEPFDFGEMASQIVLSFEQKINDKRIEVEIDFDDRLVVNGDRDRLFQAVYNLTDNAVKFTGEGGRLQLTAKKQGNLCAFEIFNTGERIPDEDITHIFDRFYKVDRSRGKDKGGAGLGLYIVKSTVNSHGGDICVSRSQEGARFSFALPLANKKEVANSQNIHNDDIKSTKL